MTSLSFLTIFEVKLTLSQKLDIFDIFHLTSNIIVSILGYIFVLIIRRLQNFEALCGPKPIIVVNNCEEENEQIFYDLFEKPSTSYQR
jgi:hypothetical protein